MGAKNDRIELLIPDGRKGATMPKHHYELLCQFVFQKLEEREKVTLTELLESVEQMLVNSMNGNLSWFVLQVKQDLEARGFINISMTKNRIQVIELKKSAWKKLSAAGGLLKIKGNADSIKPLSGIKMWHINY